MTQPDSLLETAAINDVRVPALLRQYAVHGFLVALACAYYLLNAQILLGHYDLGWHLAAGDWIRDHGRLPLHDPWSFTAGDKPWLNLSWLWDVLASVIFQHAGLGGLLSLTVICGGAITFYLASICLRTGASAAAACIAVLFASLLYPAFSAFPNIYLAAAPNMATMLFAVLFYGECLGRTKRVLLLPLVMLAWANLHGGFLLGLFILGVFGGLALRKRDWAGFSLYGLATAGSLAATLINPLGWHIYQGVTSTMGNFVQAQITEWWPYYRNITMPGSLPGMAYMLAFVALELRDRRLGVLEARLLSWLFLVLGLYQFRYMAFFFLFSAVLMTLHLDRLLSPGLRDPRIGRSWLAAATLAVSALSLACWRAAASPLELPQMLSRQDVRYLQSHFPHARLLNHWNYGGILIFYTRGTPPLFVDGRAATAYPDALLHDYFQLSQPEVDEAAWNRVLAKYRIDTVLWVKAHDALRRYLVGRKGWKEAYDGQYASIYFKP
ncbi:MAG TPA: hypothetical protein VHC39_20040 [Rhizomicrobium sp.]|nr:hypothetical protein [Rhizomicrobium sp.]